MIEIKGQFVVKYWKIFPYSRNVYYIAFFLRDRLVFVKLGANLVEKVPTIISDPDSILIGAGWGILSVLQNRNEEKKIKKKKGNIEAEIKKMNSDQLLRLDKDNFEIKYDDISKIKMQSSKFGTSSGSVRIKKKYFWKLFEIDENENYNKCERMVKSVLKDKVR